MSGSLMTVTETAAHLGVTKRRVDQLYHEGKLPKLVNHHTREVRFPRTAVVELERERSKFVLVRQAS